ncbi:hypothetical protein ACKKBF_B41015 [Auxenochlorella protothecoides x Auxenochlorella symbiontica]
MPGASEGQERLPPLATPPLKGASRSSCAPFSMTRWPHAANRLYFSSTSGSLSGTPRHLRIRRQIATDCHNSNSCPAPVVDGWRHDRYPRPPTVSSANGNPQYAR